METPDDAIKEFVKVLDRYWGDNHGKTGSYGIRYFAITACNRYRYDRQFFLPKMCPQYGRKFDGVYLQPTQEERNLIDHSWREIDTNDVWPMVTLVGEPPKASNNKDI